MILNGIEEFVQRGDLSDRTVFLNLGARSRRASGAARDELWAAFYRERPLILGSLLGRGRVEWMRGELPSVKLAELPRMADFAASPPRPSTRSAGMERGYRHRFGLQQQS